MKWIDPQLRVNSSSIGERQHRKIQTECRCRSKTVERQNNMGTNNYLIYDKNTHLFIVTAFTLYTHKNQYNFWAFWAVWYLEWGFLTDGQCPYRIGHQLSIGHLCRRLGTRK